MKQVLRNRKEFLGSWLSPNIFESPILGWCLGRPGWDQSAQECSTTACALILEFGSSRVDHNLSARRNLGRCKLLGRVIL